MHRFSRSGTSHDKTDPRNLSSFSAFTIERYIAVCRPLHTSSLSTIPRAIKIQISIWFVAIASSTPYFYITSAKDQQCEFDSDFPSFVIVSFYISAIVFFVLPAVILCCLYALMAQRLYTVDSSKFIGTEFSSAPQVESQRHSAPFTPLGRHSMKRAAFKMLCKCNGGG